MTARPPHLLSAATSFPSLHRREDGCKLGSFQIEDSGRIVSYRSTSVGDSLQHFPETLDAAVEWVLQGTHIPDLSLYPVTHKVYGPVLARWGRATLLGVVWFRSGIMARGIGNNDMLRSVQFAAMDGNGRVCAKMQHDGSWKMVVCAQDGAVRRRQHKSLPDALSLFISMCVQALPDGSRHETMELLNDLPGILMRAKAFLEQRDAWQARITDGTHPTHPTPLALDAVRMAQWPLMRKDDNFFLGRISLQHTHYVAQRLGLQQGAYAEREVLNTISLDEAVAFVLHSPHAPDRDRFPSVAFLDYGRVLWTLPRLSLVGIVGSCNTVHPRPDMRLKIMERPGNVLDTHHHHQGHVLGHVALDEDTRTWIASWVVGATTIVFHADTSLPDLLAVVQNEMIHKHDASLHEDIRAGAPAALAGMLDFIHHRPELVAELEKGTPA